MIKKIIKKSVRFVFDKLGLCILLVGISLFIFRGMEPISSGVTIVLTGLICILLISVSILATDEESEPNALVKRLSRIDVLMGFTVILTYIGAASKLLGAF